MIEKHLTTEKLNQYVDNRLDDVEAYEVRVHLKECQACRLSHQSLAKIDASLRAMPIERVHADFTHSVLATLNLSAEASFFFRIVERLPYVFGLLIVIGVMLSVFIGTEVITLQQAAETETRLVGVRNVLDGGLTATVAYINTLGMKYFSFLYSSGTARLVLMSSASVGLLFLLDRFLKRRFLTHA
jgi:anti-sigma factor RsiW